MKIKNLGSQGLKASQLGLGCMGMSEFYGEGNDAESINVIHRALELGVNFLDTADMYGPFKNETLVGKAIADRRDKVVLATKFGFVRDLANPNSRAINGRPDYLKKACDASLQRLNVDVIDLYYMHRKDPSVPIEETVGAMGELVKEGKVRTLGLSEVSTSTLRKAHATFPITALQTEYSLWSREPEEELLDTCKSLGIAFVAYSPLSRGLLTGQIKKYEDFEANDVRKNWPRFQGENFKKNLELVEKIKELAKQKKCTASQLAIAWVMAQDDHIFPIPGTKRLMYLEENVGAIDVQLTEDELKEIDTILPPEAIAGTRYPEAGMKSLNG